MHPYKYTVIAIWAWILSMAAESYGVAAVDSVTRAGNIILGVGMLIPLLGIGFGGRAAAQWYLGKELPAEWPMGKAVQVVFAFGGVLLSYSLARSAIGWLASEGKGIVPALFIILLGGCGANPENVQSAMARIEEFNSRVSSGDRSLTCTPEVRRRKW